METKEVTLAVACCDQDGRGILRVESVTVSNAEFAEGLYMDMIEARLKRDGFQEPFVLFGPDEFPTIGQVAKDLEQVAQVVVIDISGGVVQSVRCDAGDINVIAYDLDDEVDEEELGDYQVGWNGAVLNCRFTGGNATIDPGLAAVRHVKD